MLPRGIAAAAVVAALLAGCLNLSPTTTVGPDLFDGLMAEGAKATLLPDGTLNLKWAGELTKTESFTFPVPEGVTYVEAVARAADPFGLNFKRGLRDDVTQRWLCDADRHPSFLVTVVSETRCHGLAVSTAGHAWRATLVPVIPGSLDPTREVRVPFTLEMNLTTAPLDGSAARIRLDRLSKPVYEELPTEKVRIPMSDGITLYGEATRPKTDAKVPTILWSSPYGDDDRDAGKRIAEDYFMRDAVARGYAVVGVDARGFGYSEGCIDVYGPEEQQDSHDLVEWVAQQPWSDGKVGFYGQSYVATTAMQALVHAPEHLTTVVMVAPVADVWTDWHFGGVPNGENTGTPREYQTSRLTTPHLDEGPVNAILYNANDLCDPTMAARASDPRDVYDDFYKERNLTARIQNAKASMLYMQGFYDPNVKSAMIPLFFNQAPVPKKGLFGDWGHQHASRADMVLTMQAWWDYWLKGIDTGVMAGPTVEVRTNNGMFRTADAWPTPGAAPFLLHPSADGALSLDTQGSGTARYLAQPAHAGASPGGDVAEALTFTTPELGEARYFTGTPTLAFTASLSGGSNTYFAAYLYDETPDGKRGLVTFGMLNAALRNGYERHEPVPANAPVPYRLAFLPVEHVVEPGHKLVLELRSADVNDWAPTTPTQPGVVTVDLAATALDLPSLPIDVLKPAPRAARG